jgi:1,4-dihydroxy-2-naphthoate octaprenyltransferase
MVNSSNPDRTVNMSRNFFTSQNYIISLSFVLFPGIFSFCFINFLLLQSFNKKRMENEKSKSRAWLEAARPRTLTASISPVILAGAIAWHDGVFNLIPFILCILVALFAQIASNFANDYFDFKKGADSEGRKGPERAVAQGWITPKSMLRGTILMLVLSCLSGLSLLFFSSWIILPVGIAIALCVIAYSAGPFPLSYHGLGDLCVLLFYGIIPVCFTYFVQCGHFSLLSLLLSLSIGLLSTNILIINNYRDYEEDKVSGKRTTVVMFGRKSAVVAYLLNGIIAVAIVVPLLMQMPVWTEFLLALFFVIFYSTWMEMKHKKGRPLNATLGHTARNVFLFAILVSVLLILFK